MSGPVTANQLSAAHHEMGHAVIAVVEGIVVREVSIEVHSDDSVEGHCRTRRIIFSPSELQLAESERQKLKLEKLSLMILAGGCAARRYRLISNNLAISEGDEHDLGEAVKITTEIAELNGGSQRSVYSALQKQSAQLVEKHWRLIAGLAQELLASKTIDGEYVRRFVNHERANARRIVTREWVNARWAWY